MRPGKAAEAECARIAVEQGVFMRKMMVMTASLPLLLTIIRPVSAQSAGSNPSDSSGGELQTVIVTAEKRAMPLEKTPDSIAVVSGGTLLQQGMQQLDQVMASVGAVKVLQGEDGPTFFIRGVGTGVPSNIGDPEINLNIDGIYQSEPEYARAGLYDVSRIEVLRGPQGTLYGRNAVAGVVNIVTNDPVFRYEGYGSAGFGDYNLVQTQGAINLPLSDTVALRAAVGTEHHTGYLSNGADDTDVQSARVKLLWEPTDKVRLLLAADNTHEGGEGEGEIQVNPPPPGFVTNPGYTAGASVLGDSFTSANPWTSPDPNTAVRHTNFWSVHAQLDWNLGFGVLTLLPAYRDYTYQCLNCWRSETDQNNYASENQTTVEARLGSEPSSPIAWVFGLYYLSANNPSFGDQLSPGHDSFADAADNPVNVFGQSRYVSVSEAAFGQVTVPLTTRFRLIGGLRYTDDTKSETGFVSTEANGITTVSTGTFSTDRSWNATTYTAGAQLDLSKSSMLYGKVSTGYKAGGFFQGAAPDSYDPEHLRSYEAGIKNRLFGDRLELNADVFYYDYRDYQVNYLGFINPVSAGIFGIQTENAQGAKIYGADLEARWLLTRRDQLDLSIYPLHAKFRTLVLPGMFGGDYSGYGLPFAPKWSANLAYQHAFELTGGATLTARMETHLETETWVTFQEQAGTHQPGHSVSDAYLTYGPAAGRWSVSGYVRNLENTPVLTNGQGGPAMLEAADIGPPRTYGLQVSARF
jgi:iron complex outermembrane recepter protein